MDTPHVMCEECTSQDGRSIVWEAHVNTRGSYVRITTDGIVTSLQHTMR